MLRKIVSLVTVAAFLINLMGLSGCTSIVTVRTDELKTADSTQTVMATDVIKGDIRALHTKEDTIQYSVHNAYIDSVNQTVVGYDRASRYTSVPLSEVTALEVKRFSFSKTVSMTVLTFALMGALTLMVGFNADYFTSDR